MLANQKLKGETIAVAGELTSTESDPADIAAYIGDMTIGMRELADQSNLTFLAYLLDLVYEEAAIITRNKAE